MSGVPKLYRHLSAPFVPAVPGIRRAVGSTILSTPLCLFPHLGQGLGQENESSRKQDTRRPQTMDLSAAFLCYNE